MICRNLGTARRKSFLNFGGRKHCVNLLFHSSELSSVIQMVQNSNLHNMYNKRVAMFIKQFPKAKATSAVNIEK
jgi:hypothetical protein